MDDDVVAMLETVRWRERDGITPEARALIDEYVANMRAVLPKIVERRQQDLTDAYNCAVFAGGAPPDGQQPSPTTRSTWRWP
jgi:hypothetical protein